MFHPNFWRTVGIASAAFGLILLALLYVAFPEWLQDLDFWRTFGIVAAAIGQTAFALLYVTFPWWRNFLGRALFFKGASFAIVLDVQVIGRMKDWAHEDVTFVVLYCLLAVAIWVQTFTFLRVRMSARDHEVV